MTKYKFNKQKISILICMFFSCLTDSFSQSKKEQIELLTLKYDRLSIVSLEERTRFIKELEKLYIVNENIKLEKDSFRLKNDELNKQILLYKLKNDELNKQILLYKLKNDELNKQILLYKSQIEMLDSKIIKLSDSISKYSTFQILSFLIAEEIEIIAGPVLQVDYAVLQISDKTIKGFVGWASQGSSEYYISGNLVNGTYIGDVYCVGSVENCASLKGKFQLKIENMNLKLSGEARVDHDEIPIFNGKHFFNGGTLTDLLIEPKIGSKILKSNILDLGVLDLGAEILAIGNYEKINDTYNLWYKVKINDVIGWVFGGLCTVCP